MSTAPDDPISGEIPADATYEELAARLEAIVVRLEQDDLPLDEALRAYEHGVEIVRRCNDLLDGAELRITELTTSMGDRAGGQATTMHSFLFPEDDEG